MTFLLIITINFFKDEGLVHAKLVNLIKSKFNLPVFTVPRYMLTNLNENSFYLETFLNELIKRFLYFTLENILYLKNFLPN